MWRQAIYDKYGGKCAICGSTKMPNAHHWVTRRNIWGRWYIPNGILLCPSHHKFSTHFSAHQAAANVLFYLNLSRTWATDLFKQTSFGTQVTILDVKKVLAHLQGKADGY